MMKIAVVVEVGGRGVLSIAWEQIIFNKQQHTKVFRKEREIVQLDVFGYETLKCDTK